MNTLANRRAFLRGKVLRQDRSAIRPPGADERGFYDLCEQCDHCVQACPEQIISFDTQGWPVVRFDTSPCTFCGACAQACPTGALNPETVADWPWRAVFASTCLSMNAVTCRVCQDACDAQAIRFTLQPGGRSEPALDPDTCTGCGACAGACPVGAIAFTRPTPSIPEVAE
ncbi:ferredoxin-type protein NapF [Ruegeria sp.]|uniref:ferredoxin-type protein NapF n=1 Tax=Ruegeria sp. TaxID=1879320 RepID=UPI002321D3CF|nr:ferredoxin-type protein NapF [Ruegeria sp.]MDA7964430.1 ferredoxin-type protein NapF [Ruegeria sp.]